MVIAVASGKGGTGKTTVAVNLVASMKDNIRLIDCDVEEPDVQTFMNVNTKKDRNVETMIPEIDYGKCTFCRKCIEFCRFNALMQMGEQILLFEELCHSCKGCVMVCPESAISIGKREVGVIETGNKENVELVVGTLNVGEPMAPPLIEVLKDDYVMDDSVLDAPPGTSCSLVETIKDVDYCVLVTEETPMGFHDLLLAENVIQQMKIPYGVVINKSGGSYTEVKDYIEKNNLTLLMELPFDEEIAKIYSQGEILVRKSKKYRNMFLELGQNIQEKAKRD